MTRRQHANGAVRALIFLTGLVFACGLASCARGDANSAERNQRRGDEDPVSVVLATAAIRTVPVTIPAVGTAEAIQRVDVRAQISGQLQQVLFRQGDDVRKGQPLFAFDPRPFEAALKQAEAVVARDTAQLNDAQAQRDRLKHLFDRGLIPRDQMETQTASAAALAATLDADKAQVEQARLNLQYTRISSPITGRTGALDVHAGDIISANAATPLVTINQLSPIDVSFSVPARLLSQIRRYQAQGPLVVTAVAQPDVLPGAVARPSDDEAEGGAGAPITNGRLTFIDNVVDAKTATILLKATFENDRRLLWPGLFVQVTLQLDTEPDALVIPAVAVQASQRGQYVYVVKPDQTVEMRDVQVERQQGDLSIISSGLKNGEQVVTEGQLRLTPGAKVVPASRTTS